MLNIGLRYVYFYIDFVYFYFFYVCKLCVSIYISYSIKNHRHMIFYSIININMRFICCVLCVINYYMMIKL